MKLIMIGSVSRYSTDDWRSVIPAIEGGGELASLGNYNYVDGIRVIKFANKEGVERPLSSFHARFPPVPSSRSFSLIPLS